MAHEDVVDAELTLAIKKLYQLHRERPTEARQIAQGALFNLAWLIRADLPLNVLEAIQASTEKALGEVTMPDSPL